MSVESNQVITLACYWFYYFLRLAKWSNWYVSIWFYDTQLKSTLTYETFLLIKSTNERLRNTNHFPGSGQPVSELVVQYHGLSDRLGRTMRYTAISKKVAPVIHDP